MDVHTDNISDVHSLFSSSLFLQDLNNKMSHHPPETISGVVTSWLPITSAWPASTQCSYFYSRQGSGAIFNPPLPFGATAFDPLFEQRHFEIQLECFPPAVTASLSQADLISPSTISSIGPLVCPQLYTTAVNSVHNSLSTWIGCCPS